MTAPDTNVEKQTRRHWPSLAGVGSALVFVLLLVFVMVGWARSMPEPEASVPPATAPSQ